MTKINLLSLVLVLTSASAFAATKKPAPQAAAPAAPVSHNTAGTGGVPGEPTTDSCGLGWQVTQQKTLLATSTRGTTNGFIPPTFGMTSGTMGCEKHSFSMNEIESVKFAVVNADQISIEMAQGNGEYLKGFARSMGCSDSAFAEFSHMTQANFEKISTQSGVQMYESVRTQVRANPTLAANCRV